MEHILSSRIWCLSCSRPDCIITTATLDGPSYRCALCGPVVRCPLPSGANVPECYIRSLDELTHRLAAELDDDDGILDVPPLVIEPSQFRASEGGCLACGGTVTFLYWIDDREIDSGAQCHHCGDVDLVDAMIAAYGGDARRAVGELMLDADFLRDQLSTAAMLISRGYTRGWRPKYERV